jgi:trigger factor
MSTEPDEADIQVKLQAEREKNSRVVTVDRAAEMGDVVTINFTGYVDGEPFEGGEGKDYDLELGKKQFIDTFEEQLVGHSIGDDVDVNVTFPEEYHHELLKGKPALFKVEVLEVKAKELPEINDEFAQDVSEYDTLAEYRESIADKIRVEKENRALMMKRSSVVMQLVEKAVMDIPEVMYTARVDEMVEDLRFRLSQQNMTLELYMQYTNSTLQSLRANYEKPAREEVQATLVLEAVAKKENLEVSEEEYIAQIEKIAERGNLAAEDLLERVTPERKKEIIGDLMNQKALDFVVEKAVALEANKTI